jgi:hypothetical protein
MEPAELAVCCRQRRSRLLELCEPLCEISSHDCYIPRFSPIRNVRAATSPMERHVDRRHFARVAVAVRYMIESEGMP